MKVIFNFRVLLMLGLFAGIIALQLSAGSSFAQNSEDEVGIASTQTFLPLMVNSYPWVTSFGSQIKYLTNPEIANFAQDAGLNWARIDAFNWAEIEPVNTNASGYNWSAVDETTLRVANERGMKVIAVVRGTPSWAQKVQPYTCGPVKEDALADFAEFVKDLVKRYKGYPYHIKYWELGNEPDVVYSPELGYDSVFGCWGDASQTYYGGEYYAQMINVIYPAIKSVDPDAKVLIGGLLQDCDPTFDKTCHTGKFFEGILRNGINQRGDNFDIVSFHGYVPYSGPSKGLQFDEHNPKWDHRGGAVVGKINFLRFVMGKYGISKPIMHTEAALLCPEYNVTDCAIPDKEFYESQADYVIWIFVRNWANEVDSTIWYELRGPGWRYGGLLDETQTPKPAYHALKFLTQELNSASYSKRVLENTAVAGYEFTTNDKKIWVLWSPDESPHTVTFSATAKKAFDKYGTEIAISGNQITVNSPVYVEFSR